LRRHHVGLMEGLLPQIAVDLKDPLAKTHAPRWLEIGFGGGEHIAHQAALHPHVSLIGAEAFLNGVAKLLAHIEDSKVTNIRVHYGDARALLEALPAESFERIFLLYPDPWPKQRQNKRRFISQENLDHFQRILSPNGQLFVASDIPDYIDWTLEHVKEQGGFELVSQSAQAYENWIRTRYEAKAIREGRVPTYLLFIKRGE
jgi:tRNA (guanine-N7-)-methyltransferase